MDLEEKLYRENLEVAPFASRFLAFLIDKFLISLVFVWIYWDDFSGSGGDYARTTQIISQLVWQITLLSIVYEALFLSLYGATLGKLALKIRVVSTSLFDSPSLYASLLRSCLKVLGEYVFYLPYFFVFFSPLRQALHDWFAKTITIKNA